ncbi:hypothetical protein V2A60_008438 [Cordyceps javanica]
MKYAILFFAAVATTVVAAPAPAKKLPFILQDDNRLCRNPFETCVGTEQFCSFEPDPKACLAQREPAPKKQPDAKAKKLPFILQDDNRLCRNPFEKCVGTEQFCSSEPDPKACLSQREPKPKADADDDAIVFPDWK